MVYVATAYITFIFKYLKKGGIYTTAFITAIGEVLTGILGWFGDVATALLTNEIFMLLMGFIVFTLLIGVLVGLAKGIKGRKKRR